ncbi:ABC transporter permease [Vibrio splendidus]
MMFILYFRMARYRAEAVLQYRVDFIIGMLGVLLQQVVTVLTITIIMNGVPSLYGFSKYEIFLIMGITQLVRGIDMAYNDYIWVEAFGGFSGGSLLEYMTKPRPIYFQIICKRLNVQGIGTMLVGLSLILVSIKKLQIEWGGIDSLLLFGFIIQALTILFSIKLITSSFALWFGRSGQLMQIVHELLSFVVYPINIFPLALQTLLTTFIPFALIAYVPSLYWLSDVPLPDMYIFKELSKIEVIFIYSPVITVLFLTLAVGLWRLGLSRATITGT